MAKNEVLLAARRWARHEFSLRGVMIRYFVLFVGVFVVSWMPAWAADAPIVADAWQPRPDGGNPPTIRVIPAGTPDAGLDVTYENRAPHWGNLQAPAALGPGTTGIALRILKRSADASAQLTVGLEEPDGDIWFGEVLRDGRSLGQWPDGPAEVTVPVGQFRFEARGNHQREMEKVRRLILVCNNGSSHFVVQGVTVMANGITASPAPDEPITVQRGRLGAAAILDGPFPANRGAVNVQKLADLLREAGFGVTTISGGNACNAQKLNRQHFDLLALPNSPYYPAAGLVALRAFLKAGGRLLCFGGYAFDQPVAYVGGRWVPGSGGLTAAGVDQPQKSEQFNTRIGKPGDTMGLDPEQIGMFDPSCRFEGAVLAPVGAKIPPGVAGAAYSGYSAVSVIGNDSPVFTEVWAHTTPLFLFYEADGRTGSAVSLARIYGGPYRGSVWTFSGVTNYDSLNIPSVSTGLPGILRRMMKPVSIHDLATSYALYHEGERPTVSFVLENFANEPIEVSLKTEVTSILAYDIASDPSPVYSTTERLTLQPGARTIRRPLLLSFAGSIRAVRVSLSEPGGAELDGAETGFVVGDPDAARSRWPRFAFHDNSFAVNGRPQFLVGTNLTGTVFAPGNDENPATWDRDFAQMQQHGIRTARVLHFSPFVTWLKTQQTATAADLAQKAPEELMRKLDALVQIAAHHGIAIFLSVHDWIGVALSDAELQAEQSFCRQVAERYRGVGNVFWDIQNEPSVDSPDTPDVRKVWNDYLKAKYGTDQALKAAWTVSPPEAPLGEIPVKGGTEQWADLRTWDFHYLRTVLLNRWTATNAAGLRAGDPGQPVTVGYLPFLSAADKIGGQTNLDFSNMHYYGSADGLGPELGLTDHRFEGKGLSLGEFGAQQEHNERVNGQDVTANDAGWFSRVCWTTLGMGGSLAQCWCWKDMNGVVFPWGAVDRAGQPKPTLLALQKFVQESDPVIPGADQPDVLLLLPDSHRYGAQSDKLTEAMHNAIAMALGAHLAFGTIPEDALANHPDALKKAKLVIWPVPFCPSDESYSRVLDAVKAGTALLVTGDLSYSPQRRRDRLDRLTELCGVRFVREIYPDIQVNATGTGLLSSPCIEVEPTSGVSTIRSHAGRGGPLFEHAFDRGNGHFTTVYFTPDPLELHSRDPELYRSVAFQSVLALRVAPDDPNLLVFRVRLPDGQEGRVVVNGTGKPVDVRLPGFHEAAVSLQPDEGTLIRSEK